MPVEVILRVAERTWNLLPESSIRIPPGRACGRLLHALVRRWRRRRQYFGTFFLRNRPQLELIGQLADQNERASTLQIAVLGCSNGAEVYSIVAAIRSARRDLSLCVHAVDVSDEILQRAREGAYSLAAPELVDAPLFERMTEADMRAMFDRDGDRVTVKSWMRERILWHRADAADPALVAVMGQQDIVAANNFLCHMNPLEAERCLRAIARLVRPGGHLVISGIDLDVRTRVATALRWQPVTERLEDIHEGDPVMRRDWPWRYWGLEPLDTSRSDWQLRYATVFRIPAR
jgi:SAM-dependent methyltransferase